MKKVTIGEIAYFVSKGTTPTSIGLQFASRGIPFLRGEDVLGGVVNLSRVRMFIDEHSQIILKRSALMTGDVLITIAGTIGRTAYVGDDCNEANCNQAVAFIRLPLDVVDSCWLSSLLASPTYQSKFAEFVAGGAIPNVNLEQIKSLEIPLIDIEEQRQIAAKLKSQLAEVETARQALTVQLADVFQLERLYFDEFERRLFSGAENSLFSNVVKSYKNGYGARPKEGETGSIVLRIADVSQGVIDLSSTRQGSISARDAETYKLEKGNLIFIRVNGAKHIVGKCILVDKIPDGTIFNDHLIRVRLSEEILPEYAQLCASLPNARQMIEEAASTSAGQLTVNQKILDQIAIPFVDKSRQVRMIDEYRNLRSEITTLKKAINQQLDDLNKIPERLLAQAFNQ